jgi:hypothetical protein
MQYSSSLFLEDSFFMRAQRWALATALAASGAMTLTATMSAQAPRLAYKAPRTADGHPDLQGTYDVATITPVDRTAQFGNRLELTEEEARKLEGAEAARDEKLNQSDTADRDRTAPPVGGAKSNPNATYLERLFEGGGGTVGGYNNFWLAPGSRVVSVYGQKRTSIIVDPSDGRVPRMKPEAMRRNQEYLRGAVAPDASESAAAGPASGFDDPERRPLAERCLLGFGSTSGPPTLPNYFYNNLKQIVQTKDSVMILVEMVHDARIIRLNQPHLPSNIRKWMGDSIGHWEGETLVVETTNFTGKTQFRGSGENLKVTERFTRTAADTLVYRFTVEDPSTWERPWTGEYNWNASDEQIYEYACHEGNHALENVLRGARATEKSTSRQ